jgi:uncharacterized phage-associated protein
MVINHSKEKLINLIVYFVTNTKNCGKTKLFKLLYFVDFTCFKMTGKTVTGLSYFAWDKGPVPVELFKEMESPDKDFAKNFSITKIDSSDRLNIKPKNGAKFDDSHFTKLEIQIIKDITFIYKDALAKDIVEVTHLKNSPWDKTLKAKGKYKKIDFLLAFDSDVASLSMDEYKQRMDEEDEIDRLLS